MEIQKPWTVKTSYCCENKVTNKETKWKRNTQTCKKQTRKQFKNMVNDAESEDETDIRDIDKFEYNSMVNDDVLSDEEDLEETLNDAYLGR